MTKDKTTLPCGHSDYEKDGEEEYKEGHTLSFFLCNVCSRSFGLIENVK